MKRRTLAIILLCIGIVGLLLPWRYTLVETETYRIDQTVTGGKVTVSGNEFNMTLSADGKYLYADIPLYCVTDTMTFTLTGENIDLTGENVELASSQFNIAAYMASEEGNIPVINALYSLSKIAQDYKNNTND